MKSRQRQFLEAAIAYWAPGFTLETVPQSLLDKLMAHMPVPEPIRPSLASNKPPRCNAAPRARRLHDETLMVGEPPMPMNHASSMTEDACCEKRCERATRSEESEQTKLKRQITRNLNRLRELGVTDEELAVLFVDQNVMISRLLVTKDGSIILLDYDNRVVPMTPMDKCLYLLFLRHPEGIYQKDLVDYREELQMLYRRVYHGDLPEKAIKGINNMTDPTKNNCDEKLSHIRRIFNSMYQDQIAEQYSITRGKSEIRRIPLDRSKLIWE